MNMNKGPIISAVLGAAFFAIPYVGLGISVLPSLGIALTAFGAGNLLFSSEENKSIDKVKTLYDILEDAKKQNAKIYATISKVESENLKNNLAEIHETASKIIDTISKKPEKLKQAQSFFEYYLPVALKILLKYDDIENQRLEDLETKKFMASTEKMMSRINKAFKEQLSHLYQADIIDTDAEIKVFEKMLSSEGFNDINSINIKGGK